VSSVATVVTATAGSGCEARTMATTGDRRGWGIPQVWPVRGFRVRLDAMLPASLVRNDLRQYDELADEWWRPDGVFAMLHWLAAARAALVPPAARPGAITSRRPAESARSAARRGSAQQRRTAGQRG